MTLNNVINRIKKIALAHKQVRNFQAGLVTDFLNDQTTKYPSVFLQDNGGNISLDGHATTLNYRMFIMDLVNVSEATKDNEVDVQSDMVSIAMDLFAQMNDSNLSDWRISSTNNLQLVVENDGDLHAGCIIDFSIGIKYSQDRCQVPSDLLINIVDETVGVYTPADLKLVYDLKYVATGSEGKVLNIAALNGKDVLFITHESGPLYPVSNLPDSAEFVWDGTLITLGTAANVGDRFLILYRNS